MLIVQTANTVITSIEFISWCCFRPHISQIFSKLKRFLQPQWIWFRQSWLYLIEALSKKAVDITKSKGFIQSRQPAVTFCLWVCPSPFLSPFPYPSPCLVPSPHQPSPLPRPSASWTWHAEPLWGGSGLGRRRCSPCGWSPLPPGASCSVGREENRRQLM